MVDKPPTPDEQMLDAFDEGSREIQRERRTLEQNAPAKKRLVEETLEYFALLINEADLIARRRGGDSIQSGDVVKAKAALEGRAKGSFWALAAGGALLGAGLAGLADALLSAKGTAFVVVYSVAAILGLIFLYFAAPRG